jgi:AhpD family alkylhydroperoxidase
MLPRATSSRLWGSCRSSSGASPITYCRRSGRALSRLSSPTRRPYRTSTKELIGLAVSGATRCRYCCYFHTEAARLFGATEDEITEAALIAKNTMGWSTYLNTLQFDYDQFTSEFDQSVAYVREQMAAGAPA